VIDWLPRAEAVGVVGIDSDAATALAGAPFDESVSAK
jgi:hypothetical protein